MRLWALLITATQLPVSSAWRARLCTARSPAQQQLHGATGSVGSRAQRPVALGNLSDLFRQVSDGWPTFPCPLGNGGFRGMTDLAQSESHNRRGKALVGHPAPGQMRIVETTCIRWDYLCNGDLSIVISLGWARLPRAATRDSAQAVFLRPVRHVLGAPPAIRVLHWRHFQVRVRSH